MKHFFHFYQRWILLFVFAFSTGLDGAELSLFDGKSLKGWEGNTDQVWRIRDGVIVGGSLAGNPQNEFLSATEVYRNFKLTLEYKLVGTEGFVNGGVQFRSRRILSPSNEMIGYQADIGAGYSGSLYDESRRREMLMTASKELIERIEKTEDWNTYEVVAIGPQIQIFLNGQRTANWVERDSAIEQEGLIALQIHGNCKAEISFRNILIERLPESLEPPVGEVLSRFGRGQPIVPFPPFPGRVFDLKENEVVVLVGQENFVREQKSGELESLLVSGFSEKRPRLRSMAWEADTVYEQWRDLNFGDWIAQLETADAGVVIAQFGQMEALDGADRLTEFESAYHRLLDQFAGRTQRFVLVSPMPFERSLATHAPDLTQRNDDVAAYGNAVRTIAIQRNAIYVDLVTTFSDRNPNAPRLTHDGIHLTETGLRLVAEEVAKQLGAVVGTQSTIDMKGLREAIVEKNRVWFDCWRPANWSFAYGDRVSQMYGRRSGDAPSLKSSFEERRPLIDSWDTRIAGFVRGESIPDSFIEVTVKSDEPGSGMTPAEQLATLQVAEGYEINLFASEADGVVNPTQFAWDEKGMLYVACSPSYPQLGVGEKPRDYVLVLEDSDADGRADKSWRFVEGLTMIQGLEPGPDGLYVCDFDQLLFLSDSDGDGRAESKRVMFSGFGIGDTHQLINSISHGPDGSLWFTQGLHAMSLVESPWGITRLDRAGVWRLRPRSLRLEGFFGGGMAGANCWGVAFDDYGQVFHKSGDRPEGYWTVPGMVRGADPMGSSSRISADQSYHNSPEQYDSVGPLFSTSPKTTSLEILGTSALPDDLQGCALIAGYFGSVVELHKFHDEGSGYRTSQMPRLVTASNSAFRPVDVSVGPDGGMYVADWYNPIIGHYQASYADPRRDKGHGRIWRIIAKGRVAIQQPDLGAMTHLQLLKLLRSPERWTRYQAKRLLFYRPTDEVLAAADAWVQGLTQETTSSDRLLLEVIGVYESHESVRPLLVEQLLESEDFRVRAYGALVLGGWAERLENPLALLRKAVRDSHPRVRLGAVIAASYLKETSSIEIATEALNSAMDPFLEYALRQSARSLQPLWGRALAEKRLHFASPIQESYLRGLAGEPQRVISVGEDLYIKACLACHQSEGKGLPGVYPPLANSDWVSGDSERLVKIVLHGLKGAITIGGEVFNTTSELPMPAFAGLKDEEIAAVLSYIRNNFSNNSAEVTVSDVRAVREATIERVEPWEESEL